MERCFAVCAPGLEPLVGHELVELGVNIHTSHEAPHRPAETGGITFGAELADIYRLNLHLRTATRVLVRLGEEFLAKGFEELVKKAKRLEWERYLHPGQSVALRVNSHKSRLYHSGAVAERMVTAISERLGGAVTMVKPGEEDEEAASQLVMVRLVHDRVLVSVDSSGDGLHRRGYRKAMAKAPLRETLAAALLVASGWDGASPLVDPFCGSGAIPIEAVLLARRAAPGLLRRFAFMNWPGFDDGLWKKLLEEARAQEQAINIPILASDRDTGAIEAARANARRAGAEEDIQFAIQSFSSIETPPGLGWVITNPPYGLRISPRKDLRNLYAQLGNVLRAKCPGWNVAILSADDALLGQTRLHFDRSLFTVNGGVRVRLAMGVVQAD